MTIADKIKRAKNDYDAVYDAGKEKIISIHPQKTVSGSYIFVDDVSELPHDVKCKVESVNLIDVNKFNIGYEIGFEAQTDAQPNANWFTTDLVEVLPNTTYTLSGVSSKTRVEYDKNGVAVSWIKDVEWTFTTGENTHYVRFNSTIYGYSEPMLNRGATKLTYTPYVNPESVTVTRCGTNLFDKDDFTSIGGYFDGNGKYTTTSTSSYKTACIPCSPNTDYVLTKTKGARLEVGDFDRIPEMGDVINAHPKISVTQCVFKTTANAKYILIYYYNAAVETDVTAEEIEATIMLNHGTTALSYEPYNGQTFTPSADGIVEGMTRISPQMNIFTDNADAMLDVTYRISAGRQSEYDDFWDAYQQNGNRKDYFYAFAGTGWNVETFKPKYKVVPSDRSSDAEGMFCRFNWIRESVTNDVLDFSKIAHLFDFSKAVTVINLFNSAAIDNIVADISNATNCNGAFSTGWGTNGLKNITLKVSDKTPLHNAFGGGHRNLSFIEGSIIGQDISLAGAPNISKQSFINVVNALSSSASGKTATFKKSAKEANFTADEWSALIGTKTNWTFSLV